MSLLREAPFGLMRQTYKGRIKKHLGLGKTRLQSDAPGHPQVGLVSQVVRRWCHLLSTTSGGVKPLIGLVHTEEWPDFFLNLLTVFTAPTPTLKKEKKKKKKKWVRNNITDINQEELPLTEPPANTQKEKMQHFKTLATKQPCRQIKQKTLSIY